MNYLYDLATDKKKGPFAAVVKFFLFLLSLIYGLVIRILISLHRIAQLRLNCKVISVGNITLGGTGKTTLVEFIARHLKQQGHKVAILSRGYKRKFTRYAIRDTGYEEMGDESYMLSKKLADIPVIVDADRTRAAVQAIKKYGVDTVILDDGFQQWKIKKDLEIVTIDVNNPFGNRHLIPRGLLREPLSSLKRTDLFVLTKVNLTGQAQDTQNLLRSINSNAFIFTSAHKPSCFYDINKPNQLLNTDILKAKTAALFSGIGDPASFEDLIRDLGVNIGLSFKFPDHHHYTNEDLDKIIKDSKEKNIDTILTTEKDAVRLEGIRDRGYGIRILVLCIKLVIINDEQGFCNRLLKLYSI